MIQSTHCRRHIGCWGSQSCHASQRTKLNSEYQLQVRDEALSQENAKELMGGARAELEASRGALR
eukprot:968178-Amphidinium_carterae.2